MIAMLLGMAKTKKEGFFWQQTLSGSKAVQWLKPGIEYTPVKMSFGLGNILQKDGYAVGEWDIEKNCVLLHEAEGVMPLLVSSRGLVNYFMEVATGWHQAGAEPCELNGIDIITRPAEATEYMYKFDRGQGQFDPYFVMADEVRD